MPEVREKEKELRFTRSGQAVGFWVAAAVFGAACVILVSISFHRHENAQLPHAGWALLPLCASYLLARMAVRLTRHAYLILTPLGIEVFPFFRPARGMRMVYWGEIAEVEVNEGLTRLTLHFNAGKTAGIHLTLRPLVAGRRELLVRAVRGRVGQGAWADTSKML
jgi:hypothetical protein